MALTIPERFARAKEAADLTAYCDAKLTHAPGGKFICPACGSGTGPKRTPAFSIMPGGTHCHCFSCNLDGDVFDVAGAVLGTDDRMRQLEEVERFAGIVGDLEASEPYRRVLASARKAQPTPDYAAGRARERACIERARAAMTDDCDGMAYLERRGLTRDEVRALGIGYDPQRRRVILPFEPDGWYHIDRAIDDGAQPRYTKPRAEDVGEQPAYNPAALESDALVVTEGAFDAVAVNLAGGRATALCTTGHRALLRQLKERGYKGTVCIMLDADDAGRTAAGELAADLEKAGIRHLEVRQVAGCKDAADALAMPGGRDLLAAAVADALERAAEAAQEEADERYAAVLDAARVLDPVASVKALYAGTAVELPTPTGLTGLDKALDGGLRTGLIVLGAISSLGKTTLLVQVADYVAAHHRPVLFVTIEESTDALVAKSLTRLMAARGHRWRTAGVRKLDARATWDDGTWDAFLASCEDYAANVAPWLRYMEPVKRPTVASIDGVVSAMTDRYGCSPLVIVDYLQLVASEDPRDSDKRQVDSNVTDLRQLARDHGSPVVVVSSLNRASYSDDLGMTAFKESGSIEYSADVLIGMQPSSFKERIRNAVAAADEKGGKGNDWFRHKVADDIINETKRDSTRSLELVIMKHRGGMLPAGPVRVLMDAAAATYYDGVSCLSAPRSELFPGEADDAQGGGTEEGRAGADGLEERDE